MSSRQAVSILASVLGLVAVNSYAFIDPPWITPSMPTSGETVSALLHMGICDAIVFRPGYPVLTRQGNQIRLVEYGNRAPTQDLCIYPAVTTTEPIGSFAPGDYVLTIDFTYDNYPFGFATTTLGVIPFTVRSTASTEVPTLTYLGATVLLLILGSVAIRRLRAARSRR